MTYEKFVSDASEIFMTACEKTNNLASASLLVAEFCKLHGQSKEFISKLCSHLRKSAENNLTK